MTTPSDEVAEAFWVPLSAILARPVVGPRRRFRFAVSARARWRCSGYGEYVVWGLTHRALTQFLQLAKE